MSLFKVRTFLKKEILPVARKAFSERKYS